MTKNSHTSSTLSIKNSQSVNANTELIPEAPNRQAISLIVVASDLTAIVVVQEAGPSIVCIVLRRTPPATVVANVEVISIAAAVPARKTSK